MPILSTPPTRTAKFRTTAVFQFENQTGVWPVTITISRRGAITDLHFSVSDDWQFCAVLNTSQKNKIIRCLQE